MLSAVVLIFPLLQATQQAAAPIWTPGGSAVTNGQCFTSAFGNATDPGGARLRVQCSTAIANTFGSLSATLPADTFRTRRVRISADIDARNVSGGASPWIRVDGAGGMLAIDNASDRAIKGTNTGHVEATVYVPAAATRIVFGLLVSGSGDATAHGLRVQNLPRVDARAPVAPAAKLILDSAYALVRRYSLWRDTVTWSDVEPELRMIAAGAQSPADVYPAIRFLLNRLGDHHSFLMPPTATRAFSTGGAQNPQPVVRLHEPGIGYVSVPAYSGAEQKAMIDYATRLQSSLSAIVPSASCGWIVDLRGNGGGNMWPMLGGLRPFFGEAGLGSFVSASGSAPLWRAGDIVDVKPSGSLVSLDSAPVAVLTGPRTASSGEAVTISFRGRPRTRSFGLPTAGLSTANENYVLPDSSMILLTVSVEADRAGRRYGQRVEPDEAIPAASTANSDPQIERAVQWLKSLSSCAR